MIQLPSSETRTWDQANNSDLFGNIHISKNLTYDTDGYVRLSYSVRALMDDTIDADFNESAAIIRSEDYGYFIATHDECFEMDDDELLAVRPTQVATAGVPSGDLQTDVFFNSGLMIMTQDNDVDFYNPTANTWTDTNISLTATAQSQHVGASFLSLAAFAIADVNTVKLYSSPVTATPTLLVTLAILADFYITSACYFNQNLYIGTMNRYGGHAFLYVWNGYGTAAQSAWEVDSNIINEVKVHQDQIAVITGKAQLLRFTGSGFEPMDNFPVFYTGRAISDETNISIFHNSLKSNGDLLYISFTDDANDLKTTTQPEGLWAYDSGLGFMYNRYCYSNSVVLIDSIAISDINTTTNQITVAAAPITGTEVIFNALNATTPGGLTNGKRYYAIKINATHIQVALTKALALAGTPVDITSQSDGTTKVISFPNIDFGQFYLAGRTAAICPIERIIPRIEYGTDVIWSGDFYNRQLSSRTYLGTVSSAVESRGYLITPKIVAGGVTDNFNLVTLKFLPFLSDIDKIIIKYRTVDDGRDTVFMPNSASWRATWTSTTTFTTTDVNFAEDYANGKILDGYEIEFVRGGGSGILAHIVSIVNNAGTYTVTIDESFENYTSGDLANFLVRNFIKWKTITAGDSDANQFFISKQLGAKGKFLQLKVELRGVQVTIEDMIVDNVYRLKPVRE